MMDKVELFDRATEDLFIKIAEIAEEQIYDYGYMIFDEGDKSE